MAIRIGINGFGRIGRVFFRTLAGHPQFEVVGINDLTDTATLAHLLKYDSVHGRFQGTVQAGADALIINGKTIKVLAAKDPAELPWKALGVDYVVESTGHFTDRAGAGKHIAAGAKKVIISAPAKDPDLTVVLGVNEGTYKPAEHHIVSNASCTTNCLAPVVKVLHDTFGVKRGQMTTIHSYTNDQKILDFPHKDLRRARAAAISMIPTSTGAAKAVGLVLPELKGKLTGMAFRVPTPTVSVVDLTVRTVKETSYAEISAAMKKASETYLKGILGYTEDEVVSSDFIHCQLSSIYDQGSGIELNKRFFKLVSWYDNEWGYSCRVSDLVKFMIGKGL